MVPRPDVRCKDVLSKCLKQFMAQPCVHQAISQCTGHSRRATISCLSLATKWRQLSLPPTPPSLPPARDTIVQTFQFDANYLHEGIIEEFREPPQG